MERIDKLGRPILTGQEAQEMTFMRLLRAARGGKADDWNGALGAAAELALASPEPWLTRRLTRTVAVNEILDARKAGATPAEIDEIRRGLGL